MCCWCCCSVEAPSASANLPTALMSTVAALLSDHGDLLFPLHLLALILVCSNTPTLTILTLTSLAMRLIILLLLMRCRANEVNCTHS